MLKSKYNFKSVLLFGLIFIAFIISFHYLALITLDYTLTNQFDTQNFATNLDLYQKFYIEEFRGLRFGSSLYMPFIFLMDYTPYLKFAIAYIKPIYFPIAFFSVSGLLLLRKYTFKELINKFLVFDKVLYILTYSIIVFPPVTTDYYLLLLLIPMFLFSNSTYSFGYFLSLGLLFAAKNFIYFGERIISIQVFLNPLLLLLLILVELELIPIFKRTLAENTQLQEKQ
jgi:hypothetical protein